MKQEYIICTVSTTAINISGILTKHNSGTLCLATTDIYKTKKDAEIAAKVLVKNTSMLIIPVTVIQPEQ